MASDRSGRFVHNAETLLRDLVHRLELQERRAQVDTPSDLLGPGIDAYAVELADWNQDEAIFNGFWFSVPGAGHSPDIDGYFAGYTSCDPDGNGLQTATRYHENTGDDPSTWVPDMWVRRFYTPGSGVQRSYSAWQRMDAGSGGGFATVTYVDTQDAATLAAAEAYTDAHSGGGGGSGGIDIDCGGPDADGVDIDCGGP